MTWLHGRSLVCVWHSLRRFKLHYKRGRDYIHSPDPAYELKLHYIQAAQQQVQADPHSVVMLYHDEMTYYRRPTMARAYSQVADKSPLARLGYTTNRKRRISGSLNWLTGHFHAQQLHRFGVPQLLRYYGQLERAYPDAHTIYLVQDNWPVHRHPDILRFFTTSRLVPLWLPTYAPWTNPVEQVWRYLKQDVLHLHRFADDWQGLQLAVENWLNRWDRPSPDLLHSVGLSPY